MGLTVSAQIERRRSIKILDFLPFYYGHFWPNFAQKFFNLWTLIKNDHVRPKSVPRRFNQEWRPIFADTVCSNRL